jgi:hypothetical protein
LHSTLLQMITSLIFEYHLRPCGVSHTNSKSSLGPRRL